MRPEEGDAAYHWDMHRFAEEVAALVEGFDYAAFVADLQKRRAVERCIEIVGEAAVYRPSSAQNVPRLRGVRSSPSDIFLHTSTATFASTLFGAWQQYVSASCSEC